MKETWTERLRRQLADNELKAPEGLLSDVKAEMQRRGLKPARYTGRARRVQMMVRRAVAVAAMLAIAFVLWDYNSKFKLQNSESEATRLADYQGKLPNSNLRTDNSTFKPKSSKFKAQSSKFKELFAAVASALSGDGKGASTINPQYSSSAMPLGSSDLLSQTMSYDASDVVHTMRSGINSLSLSLKSNDSKLKPKNSRFTFGTAMGGGAAGLGSSTGAALAMADANFNGGSNSVNLAGLNTEKAEPYSHTEYKRPIKVGVSVGYRLSDRWSLYSGVNYSYLSSKETAAGGMYTAKQKLHYVGVPLGVSYRIAGNKHFGVYARGGVEAQKLVSGKRTERSVLNTEAANRVETTTEDVSEGRPQFSVGGAVGAEWRFTRYTSLYLEPSVTHYFDNGSTVDNVYKDKPTSLNVDFGVRLNIGK